MLSYSIVSMTVTVTLGPGGSGPCLGRNILGHEPCHDFDPMGTGKRMHTCNKDLDNSVAALVAAGLNVGASPGTGGGRGSLVKDDVLLRWDEGKDDGNAHYEQDPAGVDPISAFNGFATGNGQLGDFSVVPLLLSENPYVGNYILQLLQASPEQLPQLRQLLRNSPDQLHDNEFNGNMHSLIGNIQQLLTTSAYLRLLSISYATAYPENELEQSVQETLNQLYPEGSVSAQTASGRLAGIYAAAQVPVPAAVEPFITASELSEGEDVVLSNAAPAPLFHASPSPTSSIGPLDDPSTLEPGLWSQPGGSKYTPILTETDGKVRNRDLLKDMVKKRSKKPPRQPLRGAVPPYLLDRGDAGAADQQFNAPDELLAEITRVMDADRAENAAAYSRLHKSFTCLKLRFRTVEYLAILLAPDLSASATPGWLGMDPLPWWNSRDTLASPERAGLGPGFKDFFRWFMGRTTAAAEAAKAVEEAVEWFSLADWEASVSIATLERDRQAAAAVGGLQASPQLKASEALAANELLIEAYTHLYNSTYSPFVAADVDFVSNGMVAFLMAALQGQAPQFIQELNVRVAFPNILRTEIASLLHERLLAADRLVLQRWAGLDAEARNAQLQGANITSILQNKGYDITSIPSEVLESALNLILTEWESPDLPAGTAEGRYTAVQQALVMRVTEAWTAATPPPLIESLWNASRQMPAPGVDMGAVPSLLSRLEREWMANEIAWDAVERALRQDFHEGVPAQTTGLVQFLERKGWTVKKGPNGCIYRPDPLPSGVLWGERVGECPLPTPTKGGGKSKTGKVTATKIPKAYKAFQAIFTSYYHGLSGQSANTVAVGMGKLIGKIGIRGGQRLPAQTNGAGGFDQENPGTDPKLGSDKVQELYDKMEKMMSSAAAGGAAWEKWDPDRREETFSYYTPAMLYWINKGVRLYHGYWYPENVDYDFSVSEVIKIRSFKVMRTGNQRVLIERLLNECKSALADLVGEVADHLLETYNDIFTNTPTLVEASLNTQWQDIGQTLIDIVKAMWVANINKASAADLFGAQTCGGEGNNKQSGVLHRFNHLVFAPTATLFMKFSTSDKVSVEDRKQFIRDLKSTPMEAADKTPSQSLKNFINELLRQQCTQLNSQIIGSDGVPKGKPSGGKGLLWWREWFCINKVANWSGSIGAIDTALLKSFKVAAITDTAPPKGEPWKPRAVVDVPLATDANSTLAIVNKILTWDVPSGKKIGVTNNAMMTRIPVKGDYIVTQLSNTTGGASTPFVKDCPVEAVMDGMGTFGDCYKGLNAPNYHCSDLKVVIEQPYGEGKVNEPSDNAHDVWGGTNGDTPLRFYFSMNVACGSGGKVAVTYDLQYSNQDRKGSGLGDSEPGSYQSPYLFYTAKIGTGKVDILEANTLLRHALTAIKNQAYAFSVAADGTPNQGLSGAKSWKELFQTPYRVTIAKDGKDKANTFGYYVMTQFLGDKYMGDFGQGLYVLADQAYPPELLPWAQYRVAADGDRPSYVRNSVIALEAIDGVSEKSKLFYADSLGDLVSGTFIRRNPWGQIPGISAGGGGKRRTRRRCQRPRKTRRKGQKTKNKKTRIRKRRGKKPTRERNARRRAKTNKRFVFRK